MKKLSKTGYKIIKLIHILSASIWIGTGAVVLFLLTSVVKENNLSEILEAIETIDMKLIIPAALITLVSGLLFSVFTEWGFLKHRWIAVKYVINVIPMIAGAVLLSPAIQNMLSLAAGLGHAALIEPSFVSSRNTFTGVLVFQLTLLIIAVCLSVFKPKLGKPEKKSGGFK